MFSAKVGPYQWWSFLNILSSFLVNAKFSTGRKNVQSNIRFGCTITCERDVQIDVCLDVSLAFLIYVRHRLFWADFIFWENIFLWKTFSSVWCYGLRKNIFRGKHFPPNPVESSPLVLVETDTPYPFWEEVEKLTRRYEYILKQQYIILLF